MKYAVIKIGGNQYKVKEGEEFFVDRLDGKPELEVLLVVDRDKVKVGRPTLSDVKVTVEVVEPLVKGEKIRVSTFKAKARYRKTKGFRPLYTGLKVKSINL